MHFAGLTLFLWVLFIGCQNQPTTSLFDGKSLAGWDTYIRAAADSLPAPGVNNDPTHVFSVVNLDGVPAIRVSGEIYGGLSTTSEYANYHLRLQFKWGEAKTAAFKNRKRDSGLLYHAVGPHGVDAGSWMRSQEFQIQETDCGDYWGVAGGMFDVPAIRNDGGEWIYDPKGALTHFSDSSAAGRRCRRSVDVEKAHGEWNTLDLYCLGDSSVHVMNGVVVMRLYHSQQLEKGIPLPLTKGKIQLQSEGSEIYYRNIEWEPIREFPSEVKIQ